MYAKILLPFITAMVFLTFYTCHARPSELNEDIKGGDLKRFEDNGAAPDYSRMDMNAKKDKIEECPSPDGRWQC